MNKIKEFIKTTKGKIVFIILVISVISIGLVVSQIPPSAEKLYDEYEKTNRLLGASYGFDYLDLKCDGKGLFGKLETKRKIQVLNMSINKINNDFVSATGGTVDDYNNVKITEVNIENTYSHSSDYKDILVTVKNGASKNISYIKIDLYFTDKSKNIIKSEWTNDNSTIKPGASQTIDKMTKNDGWEVVSAEISEVKFK